MSKSKRNKHKSRDTPERAAKSVMLREVSPDMFEAWLRDPGGFIPLWQAPEVQMCIRQYAELVSNMTIRLMENTDEGDKRVKNELARMLDITPNEFINRKAFITWIISTMLGEGDGNAVVFPVYKNDLLASLEPLDPALVVIEDTTDRYRYRIRYGSRVFRPDEVLHFVYNPDPHAPWRGRGFRVSLRQMVDAIAKAEKTKEKLLQSPTPSLIVSVEGLSEEFTSPAGRSKLVDKYIETERSGEPWIIPADMVKISEVKPLSIKDLAIGENITLDQKKIAKLLGVPAFVVGVGEYNEAEYTYFVSQAVCGVAHILEQEMTRKLLYKEEWHFVFNPFSLYNYRIKEKVEAGKELVDRMAMERNELRDWVGLSPDPMYKGLYGLENYLPVDRLGDQKKLNGKGGADDA